MMARKPKDPKDVADRAEARSKAKRTTASGKTAAQPDGDPAKPRTEGDRYRLTSGNDLKNLLRRTAALQKQAQSTSGEIGEMIAKAVETKHLHRKAFSTLRTAARMEPEKAAEFWHQLFHYYEASGEKDRCDAVGRFDMGEGNGESESEGDPEPGNVARPRFGAGHPNFGGDTGVAGIAGAAGAKLPN